MQNERKEANCKRCGTVFPVLNNRKRVFCSRDCSEQKSIALCTCKTCGSQFHSRHIKKYCSIECNPNYHRLNLPERCCLHCNASFKPRFKAQKYCKREHNPYKKVIIKGFYQSKEWKLIRANYIASSTLVNGISLSNRFCIECYIKDNRLNDMYAVDHKNRLKDGGTHDHSNLQSLCRHHHQSKSASEGNRERYKLIKS